MRIPTRLIRMSMLAFAAVAACSSGFAGAAQYLETGTPAPTSTETAAGGDWSILAAALVGGNSVPATSTITGDTYVLPSSGVEVIIADGVVVSDSGEGSVEDQIILETDAGIGAVAVIAAPGQPSLTLDRYVSGFAETMDEVVEVDVQSSTDVATGVYRVETSGLTLYMYISADTRPVSGFTVIEVVIADAGGMESSIVQMRDNVSIDGVQAFAGVDEAGVADTIRTDEG